MSEMFRLALLASGNGTNALSIIQNLPSNLKVEFVLSDQAEAAVLKKAADLGVRTYLVEKKSTKAAHENEILKLMKEHHVDWICLAGYMRILSGEFLAEFSRWHGGQDQVVNIHPSALPAYPGVESIKRAFDDRVEESGVTLHFVDPGVDTGKIVLQKKVPLSNDEDFHSLRAGFTPPNTKFIKCF